MHIRLLVLFSLTVLSAFAGGHSIWAAVAEAPPAELSQTKFEARGRQEAILTVNQFGRYALSTKSGQGTSLQIVDRMLGPGEIAGMAGVKDGRVDAFFEAGHYKIVTHSHKDGRGTVDLTVRSFKEINQPQAPLLIEYKPIDATLEDCQQMSYWLEIKERRFVYIEAEGRDLADVRLWQDGTWLLDVAPDTTVRESVGGHPQTYCAVVADLNPGLYLVTAYGGVPQPWAKETNEHPFHLRYGVPVLPTNSDTLTRLSSFGMDRYFVPKECDFFFLQLQEKKDFRLQVQLVNSGDHFGEPRYSAVINKKSQDPECLVTKDDDSLPAIVTVSGPPGELYELQIFQRQWRLAFDRPGDNWLSTIHSGHVEDNIDATGFLVAEIPGSPATLAAADVIAIGSGRSWSRRFNLLGDEDIFFFVEEAGDYEVKSAGTAASFRFVPAVQHHVEGFEAPALKPGGGLFSLDRGMWLLEIHADQKGILKVAVQKAGGVMSRLFEMLSSEEPSDFQPVKGAIVLEKISYDPKLTYTLWTNTQFGVDHGLIVRPYPLSLDDALPVVLRPGQEQTIAFAASEGSQLTVTTGPRPVYSLAVDGGACQESCPVAQGPHTLVIKNNGTKTRLFSLRTVATRLLPDSSPRYLESTALQALPKFPVLTEQSPQYADFGVTEKKTFILNVASPALYKIETTGLLKTAISVRTRSRVKLFSAEANGIGRNALVQQYLKEGEYQVTAQTLDRSAGHAGVRLVRTDVVDGGALTIGKMAKNAVPAGSAVQYAFEIPKIASYNITTIGQNKSYRCRLEDKDGWPLRDPNGATGFTDDYAPGTYRYMTLPWDVDTLRVTRLEEVVPPKQAEGHGPHALQLDVALDNTWRESPEGSARQRDLYDITIPAALDATITLGSDQMQGFLKKKNGEEYVVVDTVPPAKAWTGALGMGDYRLEVECSRPNDHLSYTVLVRTAQLVDGSARTISAPGTIEVSVGKEGTVELFSNGTLDVRGTLLSGPGGDLIDSNDDSFNDWNFTIARRLPAGQYMLQVDPVGKQSGDTKVSMRIPAEVRHEVAGAPGDRTIALDGKINILPIGPLGGRDLLDVRASGASFLGCVLERVDGESVTPVVHEIGRACRLTAAVDPSAAYQIRLWSADHQSETARLQIQALTAAVVPLSDLERSVEIIPQPSAGGHVAAATLDVPTAGTFRVERSGDLRYGTSSDPALIPAESDLIALPAGLVKLAWDCKGPSPVRIKASRHVLDSTPAGGYRTAVSRSRPQSIDMMNRLGGVTVLTAESVTGRPACAFTTTAGDRLGAYSMSQDACASVASTGTPLKARIWDASSSGPASSLFTIRLYNFGKPSQPAAPLLPGQLADQLKAADQRQWSLPAGGKQIDVTLDPGLVAFTFDGSGVSEVAAARDTSVQHTFMTTAAHLGIVNTSSNPASCKVTVLKRDPQSFELELATGDPFESETSLAGSIRLRLPATLAQTPDAVLCIEGAGVAGEWTDEKGVVHAGDTFDVGGHQGFVTITHAPGLVKAWISEKSSLLRGRWGSLPEAPIVPAQNNSALALDADVHWYGIALTNPSVIHLAGAQPAVVAVSRRLENGPPASVSAFLQLTGRNDPFVRVVEALPVDHFLLPGNYVIGVRAFRGGRLSGTITYSAQPIRPIGSGEWILAGGEAETFYFEVRAKSWIGIGVKADRDAVDCALLTKEERLLGRGIQQFVQLDPGTYLLRLTLSPGEAPVHYKPVALGLEPPGIGPPLDYLREFFVQIGLTEGGAQ